jgi:uncharacterized glyoxalase superfamily protein PhnB
MSVNVKSATPVLPAADTLASLEWWTKICGFTEVFRDTTPPNYCGISRGGASLHLSHMRDPQLARTIGEQTMVRIMVDDPAAFYAEYQKRGGAVHPNGAPKATPWGSTEFACIDPNGVCVTFYG